MPEAQGPEENRNDVLNPAMEQRYTARRRRQMRRCGIDEDPDQNVDPNEEAICAEKGFQEFHLSHLLFVELVRMSDCYTCVSLSRPTVLRSLATYCAL